MTDDEKWIVPRKLRVSTDPTDEAGYALLKQAEDDQKELAKHTPSPFSSSRASYRQKAWQTIRGLMSLKQHAKIDESYTELLAESWAVVGHYDLAANITHNKDKADVYRKYWEAVNHPASCKHPDKHWFLKEYVFSVRLNREVPLLACNICKVWTTDKAPEEVISRSETSHAGKTQGLSIDQAKAYHQNTVK